MLAISETLCVMDTHQIAGSIVRDELARRGLRHDKAAQQVHMSKSTLARLLSGDPRISELTLRQVEGLLDMPRRFLTLVIDADVARIKRLDDMDPDLRRHAIEALSDLGGRGDRRRSDDAG